VPVASGRSGIQQSLIASGNVTFAKIVDRDDGIDEGLSAWRNYP
jgi:hypothetical protein